MPEQQLLCTMSGHRLPSPPASPQQCSQARQKHPQAAAARRSRQCQLPSKMHQQTHTSPSLATCRASRGSRQRVQPGSQQHCAGSSLQAQQHQGSSQLPGRHHQQAVVMSRHMAGHPLLHGMNSTCQQLQLQQATRGSALHHHHAHPAGRGSTRGR